MFNVQRWSQLCPCGGPLSRGRVTVGALCCVAVSASASGVDADRSLVRVDVPQATAAASGSRARRFDIPAQPLAAALNRYASVSGWPILFHGTMVAGRISSPLQGDYEPEVALHRLLAGTGLAPVKVEAGPADAYTLKAANPRESDADSEAQGVDFDYGGWVQARIWQALCADARTTPGRWRSLLRFRVDADGHVHGARMFNSTGTAVRDAAVIAALQRVRMERAPPPDMLQPLTMLIVPLAQGDAQPCAGTVAGVEHGRPSAHD